MHSPAVSIELVKEFLELAHRDAALDCRAHAPNGRVARKVGFGEGRVEGGGRRVDGGGWREKGGGRRRRQASFEFWLAADVPTGYLGRLVRSFRG